MRSILMTMGLMAAGAMSAQAGEAVTYQADGAEYEGYYAAAGEESKGLVLVIHDWDGLDDYEMKRADMLAEMGYNAFALDLYGKGNRPESVDARKAETAKLYDDREAMRTRILAGLDEARSQSGGEGEAVVMGYCFGGAAVLELARSGKAQNVAGYATFHGGLTTPEGQSYSSDTPPLLIAHGGADSSISLDDAAGLAKQLEEAGVTYELEVYSGAPHAFTVFGSDRYQERADEKSWMSFGNFLERNLAGDS
ncbi:dienelactone hydrolase family protein [Notoacmeibacter sp. MSK16QG-6]|uniref:dienelactone hydrolase family protein n=1 Tax=Notoacmeibacter sp. MSK16QG-6 TaxID=2957982 RepID=UPI00209DCCB2|nr:dienelactone hydrolase family protein [Notoacmeibacter sp. MSK16QG-6]MCP1199271.1 dienelactone hydrolase family protein [Notoacmeibacter sp. MSK16QG-6]